MKRKKIIYIIVILFIILFGPSSYAFRFNIDNPKIILRIRPGEKSVGYITVDNYGYNKALTVRAYAQDMIYLPDGSNDFIPEGSTKWSLAGWLKVEPKEFRLRGNNSQLVRYIVRVPPDAEGGRYGVIFFETALPIPPPTLRGSTQTAGVRLGSIFDVTIRGTEKYEADLIGLKANLKKDGDFAAYCIVRNLGNVLIRPAGEAVIMDREGNEIAKKDVNPTEGGILPDTNRKFIIKWKQYELDLESGKDYILQVTLDCGGDALLGGQTYFSKN